MENFRDKYKVNILGQADIKYIDIVINHSVNQVFEEQIAVLLEKKIEDLRDEIRKIQSYKTRINQMFEIGFSEAEEEIRLITQRHENEHAKKSSFITELQTRISRKMEELHTFHSSNSCCATYIIERDLAINKALETSQLDNKNVIEYLNSKTKKDEKEK